jgi:hypothetical protein
VAAALVWPPHVFGCALRPLVAVIVRRRTTFLCSLAFSVSLDEPGSAAWVVALASNASLPQLPFPAALVGAADASQFFLAGSTPAGSMQLAAAGAPANASITGLASQTNYSLVLAAKDAAPLPNYIPTLVVLPLAAPDVRPPVFTGLLGAQPRLETAAAAAGRR